MKGNKISFAYKNSSIVIQSNVPECEILGADQSRDGGARGEGRWEPKLVFMHMTFVVKM